MSFGAPPLAVDSRGRRYLLHPDHVRRESRGGVLRIPLDDPARPRFLGLPRVDLDDGRPLVAAAFEVWAGHVARRLREAGGFETRRRPAQPAATFLSMTGALLLGVASVWLLVRWSMTEPARVSTQAGIVDAVLMVVSLGMPMVLFVVSLISLRKGWLLRHGSFVHLDRRGIRWGSGRDVAPLDVVVRATYHSWLRCIRLDFREGGVLWVPAEAGPLRRLDLVLAALHPPLRGMLAPLGVRTT